MKIDRHKPVCETKDVKLTVLGCLVLFLACTHAGCGRSSQDVASRNSGGPEAKPNQVKAQPVSQMTALEVTAASAELPAEKKSPETNSPRSAIASPRSQPQAIALLRQVLHQFANGPAFDAKIRETVWTSGREVRGVGSYKQAGEGSGQFNLQMTMHDGHGQHRLQQISDGRLFWTRSEVAGKVKLRRVDVSRLEEWVRNSLTGSELSPRLKIGGWTEMLDMIQRDHTLRVDAASLQGEPVWVLTGMLKPSRRKEILKESGRSEWPQLYPTKVCIAIRSQPEPESGFGRLLPARIEFWSDPVRDVASDAPRQERGRLITLIEIYSVYAINRPAIEQFRFENLDAEVNFTNETERYVEQYGVEITDSQRRLLRR